MRFAPLTMSSLVALGAVGVAIGQLINDIGADAVDVGGIRERLTTALLWLGVAAIAALMVVIAIAGAVGIFIEAWWDFQLTHEVSGTIRIRRGLFTTRSVSLEERRLRGALVVEPPRLRLGQGAPTVAVATGLVGRRGHGRGNLLRPPQGTRRIGWRRWCSPRTLPHDDDVVPASAGGAAAFQGNRLDGGTVVLPATRRPDHSDRDHGRYPVIDEEVTEGLTVAAQAVPGLLDPFLHRD